MLEILKFIFSSFWVWLGTAILLALLSSTIEACGKVLLSLVKK